MTTFSNFLSHIGIIHRQRQKGSHPPKGKMFVHGGENETSGEPNPVKTKAVPIRHVDVFHHINIPKRILTHILGKNHPVWSRLILGLGIMYAGSMIPEVNAFIKLLAGLLHATGAVPWIDSMIAMSEPPPTCETCNS